MQLWITLCLSRESFSGIIGYMLKGNEMKFIKELAQATLAAALFFGPLFYYFMFMMKP